MTYAFQPAQTDQDTRDILALQALNHKSVLTLETKQAQGFVTVKHEYEVLRDMNAAYPAAIARHIESGALAGYALTMHPSFSSRVPILDELFERLGHLEWQGRPVGQYRWFVMGQICVAEAHRGGIIFDQLYQTLRTMWQGQFDLIITEVSEENTRSMRAHERVGFETMQAYINPVTGEGWRVIGWAI
jgi:hypothetical protein